MRDPSEVFQAIDIAAELITTMKTKLKTAAEASERSESDAGDRTAETETSFTSDSPVPPVVVIPTASYSACVFTGTDQRNRSPEAIRAFAESLQPLIRRGSQLLEDHIGIVHLKELALTDDFHIHAGLAPIGEGPTDWASLLRSIRDVIKTDVWVLIEHVLTYDEGVSSIQRIASILSDIE